MTEVHHKYDSTAGYILQLLRMMIVFIFLIGIIRTSNLSVGNTRRFIRKFGAIGAVYLLSWPLTVVVS
jgi:hypothetical protein